MKVSAEAIPESEDRPSKRASRKLPSPAKNKCKTKLTSIAITVSKSTYIQFPGYRSPTCGIARKGMPVNW